MASNPLAVFQFAELRVGAAAAQAYASVATQFIQHFAKSPHYDTILTTLVEQLLIEKAVPHSEEMLQAFVAALNERQSSLLEAEKEKEKRKTNKWAPRAVVDLDASSDSEPEDSSLSPEELQKLKKEEEERKTAEWMAACRREEEREWKELENAEKLKSRQRHVDNSAFGDQGAVLINEASYSKTVKFGKAKGGKKGGAAPMLSPEECAVAVNELDTVRKERELLQPLVLLSEEELPAALTALQAEVQVLQAEIKAHPPAALPAVTFTKGQVTELRDKKIKQTNEKTRLVMQLKSLDAEVGTKIVEEVRQKAACLVSLHRLEA